MLTLTPTTSGTIKSVATGFNDFWYRELERAATAGGVTPESAFREVGRVWSAVDIFAGKVADMPFDIEQNGKDVKEQYANTLLLDWQERLKITALSVIVKEKAYWYLATDASGRSITPVLLETNMVTPYDDGYDIVGFRYYGRLKNPVTGEFIPAQIGPERMIWFWYPDPGGSHIRPGPGPLRAALANAGVVRAVDMMITGYFNRGGVPMTAFITPPGVDENELKKFQGILDKLASGVKNAFKWVSFRGDLKTLELGKPLKEAQANELYTLNSDRILEPFHIPPGLIDGKSANYATMYVSWIQFYDIGIVPAWNLIAEKVNKKVFSAGKSKARLVAKPNRLEAYQQAQLAQAEAVGKVVGQPPMTVAEGRDVLELPPLEGAPEVVQYGVGQSQAMLSVVTSVGKSEITPEQGAAILTALFPALSKAQIDAMTTPPEKPEPAPVVVAPPAPPRADSEEQEPEMEEVEPDSEEVTKALASWRKNVLRSVKCGGATLGGRIDSIVPHDIADEIAGGLAYCKTASDVRAVFDKHWPKPKPQKSAVPPQVLSLLERAVKLQEEQRQ